MGTSSGKNTSSAAVHPREPFAKRLNGFLRMIDVWRLLVAIVLAVLTYSFVSDYSKTGRYSSWREIIVPLDVQAGAGDGRIFLPTQKPIVKLEIQVDVFHLKDEFKLEEFGIRLDMNRLLAAMVDVPPSQKNTEPWEVPYKVSEMDVYKKPVGVSVHSVLNGDIKLKCDRVQSRQIPVSMSIDRSKQDKNFTYECVPKMEFVTVTGPAYEINKIEKIQSEKVFPTGSQQTSQYVKLQVPHAMAGSIQLDPSAVECSIVPKRNSSEAVTRAFNNLRVFFLNRWDSQLKPQVKGGEDATLVNVHLKGLGSILDTISKEQLRVICDLTPFTLEGGQRVKLSVAGLPPDVSVEHFYPSESLEVELSYAEEKAIQPEKSETAIEEMKGDE